MSMAWYIVVFFIHIWLGARIAHLSRAVVKQWDYACTTPVAARSFCARLWLYPASAMETIECKENGPIGIIFDNFREKSCYIILHMLFWELRIIFNLAVIIVLLLVVSPIAAIVYFVRASLINIAKS